MVVRRFRPHRGALSAQCRDFVRRENAVFPRFQAIESYRPDGRARQPHDVESGVGAHLAYLPVASFMEHEFENRMGSSFADLPHFDWPQKVAVYRHRTAQRRQRFFVAAPGDLHEIRLRVAAARMRDFRNQVAVVRHQQESRTILIQTAHRH